MRHPTESELALYAGNDLGRVARLRVDWHLRTCGKCQQEITEFSSLRAETMRSASEPEINWERLGAEMKANIRVGLEAGKCIAPVEAHHHGHRAWAWAATAAALAGIAAVGQIWMNHSWTAGGHAAPFAAASSPESQDFVLETKGSAIQMLGGSGVMSQLRSANSADIPIVSSVDARGGVGASYVDRETGIVTVNNIYAYGQ
jgi:hypothetical protein